MATTESQHEGGIRLHFSFHSKVGTAGVVSGPVDHEDEYKNSYGSGSTNGQITQLFSKKYTIAASSSTSIDLTAETDDLGIQKGFSKINSWEFRTLTKNGQVNVKQGATNPWSALFDDDSDVAADSVPLLKVPYGCQMGDAPTGLVVTSSSKNIVLANPNASSVDFELRLSGVAA